jgi:hypothetical protein
VAVEVILWEGVTRKGIMLRQVECIMFGNQGEVGTEAMLSLSNKISFHFSGLCITSL